MRKLVYKGLVVVGVLCLVVSMASTAALKASDFDDPALYEQWKQTCQQQKSKYPQECTLFANYLAQKSAAAQQTITDNAQALQQTELDLADIQKSLDAYGTLITSYVQQQNAIRSDIESLNQSISAVQAQIDERIATIAAMDQTIKARMVAMETYSKTSIWFDFVLKAKDFADLLTRWDDIQTITSSDRKLIQKYNDEKTALNDDQNQQLANRDALDAQQAALATSLASAQSTENELQQKFMQFTALQEKLQDDTVVAEQTVADNQALAQRLGDLSSVVTSSGWGMPMAVRFQVTALAWAYPADFGGGWHAGNDLGPVGANYYNTPALAPGNGVVVHSNNNCDSYNSPSCGDPTGLGSQLGGNQVYMIVDVNSQAFGVVYKHLVAGSALSPTTIKMGDQVGIVGNSGQSFGNHLHVEVVYLGDISASRPLSAYVSEWRNGNFGAPASNASSSSLCENNGNRAPCRPRPQDIWGFQLYHYYN